MGWHCGHLEMFKSVSVSYDRQCCGVLQGASSPTLTGPGCSCTASRAHKRSVCGFAAYVPLPRPRQPRLHGRLLLPSLTVAPPTAALQLRGQPRVLLCRGVRYLHVGSTHASYLPCALSLRGAAQCRAARRCASVQVPQPACTVARCCTALDPLGACRGCTKQGQ